MQVTSPLGHNWQRPGAHSLQGEGGAHLGSGALTGWPGSPSHPPAALAHPPLLYWLLCPHSPPEGKGHKSETQLSTIDLDRSSPFPWRPSPAHLAARFPGGYSWLRPRLRSAPSRGCEDEVAGTHSIPSCELFGWQFPWVCNTVFLSRSKALPETPRGPEWDLGSVGLEG